VSTGPCVGVSGTPKTVKGKARRVKVKKAHKNTTDDVDGPKTCPIGEVFGPSTGVTRVKGADS
jgi:hypothetical protein